MAAGRKAEISLGIRAFSASVKPNIGGNEMTGTINKLLGRQERAIEKQAIGEDMVPSPDALAERSALSGGAADASVKSNTRPFRSAVDGPVRDFAR